MSAVATLIAAAAALAAPGTPPAPSAAPTDDTPPRLEFAFEEEVTLAPTIVVGRTPIGGRNIAPITGGRFTGPGFSGTILPGGWDWQLERADGCIRVHADYMLRTDDGTVINIINGGVGCPKETPPGAPPSLHTMATFEAPVGKYDWLNKTAMVGKLVLGGSAAQPHVTIRFYRVTS